VVGVDFECEIASGAMAGRRWSVAEPKGSHGGVAVSGAEGRYSNEMRGLTVL
jgi:hypothetical protein